MPDRNSRLLAAAVLVFQVAAAGGADSPPPFAVAVLRRDGNLIPIAAFDGRRWSSPWPSPQRELEVPINLASVPKAWWGPTPPLSDWQLWPLEPAAAPRELHVTQPDWVEAHCTRRVALKTDYRSALPAPPSSEQPYPKDGLAISPPHALERIDIVPPDSEGTGALASELRERFNRAERETESEYGHPLPRRKREALQPMIERLYAFGDTPRAYYVEASRRYEQDSASHCTVGFATGWFVRDGDRTAWPDMAVDLLPCNLYGATYMLPLGALRVGARTFWIAQFASWRGERYVVIEIKKNRVEAAVSMPGGGC